MHFVVSLKSLLLVILIIKFEGGQGMAIDHVANAKCNGVYVGRRCGNDVCGKSIGCTQFRCNLQNLKCKVDFAQRIFKKA